MTDAPRNIFLSYASQDAAVAARLGEALRAAGLEVWFDQSELRGGDAWDQLIRRRIRECALFVPVISAHTQDRLEGYFRLEWRLAVDRSHLMAERRTFLVPVVIDSIAEPDAEVPDAFRAVQWTHLPAGTATPAFVSRITQLLSAVPTAAVAGAAHPVAIPTAAVAAAPATPVAAIRRRSGLPVILGVAAVAAIALLAAWLGHKSPASPPLVPAPPAVTAAPVTPAPATSATVSGPPAHSVAVLPFTNMSGDAKDDYFSDGLSEELLNTLASVQGLKVAARTSSFSFKGKDEPVGEIARKLNVAAILEGSVRREKSHVRISAELIDASTGFQHWSQTYDRDLKDVLALQSDIAKSVAAALKVALLQSDGGGREPGGTSNPRAFDAYLRAEALSHASPEAKFSDIEREYSAAIDLDPAYANAYSGRGVARIHEAFEGSVTPAQTSHLIELGLADARKAAQLAPALGFAYSVLGQGLAGQQDFVGAMAAFEKAQALSPGDIRAARTVSAFFAVMGRPDQAVALARHALELDPLNPISYSTLASVYMYTGRYPEAVEAARRATTLDPGRYQAHMYEGLSEIGRGDYQAARAACEALQTDWPRLTCLAVVYEKLGRHAEATAALARLIKDFGDGASYQQVQIYAQWGDLPRALDSLDAAVATQDPGLQNLKVDFLLAPLHDQPRFKAVVAKLKFPN